MAVQRVTHPGPVHPVRIESLEGRGRTLAFALEPGLTLNEAIARPLVAAGLEAAAVTLRGVTLGPMVYVLPAPARSAGRLAAYSEPYPVPGATRIEVANASFGRRDGEPFVHCHAAWTGADGRRLVGHVLPHETVVVASPPPSAARAWGLAEVGLRTLPDPETEFTLFQPVALDRAAAAAAPADGGPRLVVARLRPNEDITEGLEALCRRHGLRAAAVRGSLGGLSRPVFEPERAVVDEIATEVLIQGGGVTPDAAGNPRAHVDAVVTGMAGTTHEGRLVRGRNLVSVTLELFLEELPAA